MRAAIVILVVAAPLAAADSAAAPKIHNSHSKYHYRQPGDKISTDADTCDGAHDHCLPAEVQLAVDPDYPRSARAVLDTPEGAYDLQSEATFKDRFTLHETEAATAANVKKGDTVICFRVGDGPPESEAAAVGTDWIVGKVDGVRGADVVIGKGSAAIASCRRVTK